jgi:UrcA family protein
MTIRFNALAAIAVACLAYAAPAAAQDRVPVTARVMIADLDLAHPAGQAALKARIHHAAIAACASDMPGLVEASDVARCRREMEQDGTAQIAARVSRNVEVAAAR